MSKLRSAGRRIVEVRICLKKGWLKDHLFVLVSGVFCMCLYVNGFRVVIVINY